MKYANKVKEGKERTVRKGTARKIFALGQEGKESKAKLGRKGQRGKDATWREQDCSENKERTARKGQRGKDY